MCEGTVGAVFAAVAFGIRLVDTGPSFIVTEVISALCVARRPVQKGTSKTQRRASNTSAPVWDDAATL